MSLTPQRQQTGSTPQRPKKDSIQGAEEEEEAPRTRGRHKKAQEEAAEQEEAVEQEEAAPRKRGRPKKAQEEAPRKPKKAIDQEEAPKKSKRVKYSGFEEGITLIRLGLKKMLVQFRKM